MFSFFKNKAHPTQPPGQDGRRSPRLETATLSCELGTIVNISRHGVLVRSPGRFPLPPGADLHLELTAPADAVCVRARVVRVRPLKDGRAEVALDFSTLDDSERQAVENLARYGKRRAPGTPVDEGHRERLVAALRMPDYYQVLGVPPGTPPNEVHLAYRALARTHHPDVCKDPGAHERFCLINKAHETLTDPDKRPAYDDLYKLRAA
jgi:hypothetical protein